MLIVKFINNTRLSQLMDQLEELESTFLEEYSSAMLLEKGAKYKSATILLSKAVFALVDYILFRKYKVLPKNHVERFRILERREPDLYSLLDALWNDYTDTYHKPAAEESIILMKETIEKISQNESTSPKIKESVRKA